MALYHHDNDSDHLIIDNSQGPGSQDGLLQSKCGHWLLLKCHVVVFNQYPDYTLSWLIRGEREKIGLGINLAG